MINYQAPSITNCFCLIYYFVDPESNEDQLEASIERKLGGWLETAIVLREDILVNEELVAKKYYCIIKFRELIYYDQSLFSDLLHDRFCRTYRPAVIPMDDINDFIKIIKSDGVRLTT